LSFIGGRKERQRSYVDSSAGTKRKPSYIVNLAAIFSKGKTLDAHLFKESGEGTTVGEYASAVDVKEPTSEEHRENNAQMHFFC